MKSQPLVWLPLDRIQASAEEEGQLHPCNVLRIEPSSVG